MNTIELHGHHINYDDNVKEAVKYIEEHLDEKEFQTLFDYAKHYQEAYFQDNLTHHYIIEYKNGEYFIIKR